MLEALKLIHRPKKEYEKKLFDEKVTIYHQRLIYDELLAHQFFFRGKYHENKSYKSKPVLYSDDVQQAFLKNLEFKLTNQQQSVFSEIKNNLNQI